MGVPFKKDPDTLISAKLHWGKHSVRLIMARFF